MRMGILEIIHPDCYVLGWIFNKVLDSRQYGVYYRGITKKGTQMTTETHLLHGENAVVPVKELPSNLAWHEESMSIIGHSETGHHHTLQPTKDSKTELAELDGKLYIRITGQADVSHKKSHDVHETVTLDEGVYVVTHKTEYDPFAQIRRAVFD